MILNPGTIDPGYSYLPSGTGVSCALIGISNMSTYSLPALTTILCVVIIPTEFIDVYFGPKLCRVIYLNGVSTIAPLRNLPNLQVLLGVWCNFQTCLIWDRKLVVMSITNIPSGVFSSLTQLFELFAWNSQLFLDLKNESEHYSAT